MEEASTFARRREWSLLKIPIAETDRGVKNLKMPHRNGRERGREGEGGRGREERGRVRVGERGGEAEIQEARTHQVQGLGFRVWGLGFRFRKHKRIRFMQGDNSWGMHIKLQNQNPNHKPQTIHPKPKIKSKHLQRRVSVPRTRICTGSAQAQPQKQPQTQHQTQAQIHKTQTRVLPKGITRPPGAEACSKARCACRSRRPSISVAPTTPYKRISGVLR